VKFTNIEHLDVSPGRLTVWRPTSPPGDEDWLPDARAASYAQEAHITRAVARGGGEGGPSEPGAPAWLATVFELPGRAGGAGGALESALLTWIDRHESLLSRLVPADDGRIQRITLRPGAVTLQRTVVGDFSSGTEIGEHIEDLFDEETDPLAWPSFIFVVVEHPESTTLYLSFDHSNVDGYSILLMAHEIRELYAAALTGVPAALAQVGSYLDFADTERGYADRIHDEHETVVRWRDFLTTDGEKPDRDRDAEFEMADRVSRDAISGWWEEGWTIALASIESLTPGDLERTVTIRGESFHVVEALNRLATHAAYHVGQIVLLAKHFAGPNWKSLSIPKGQSKHAKGTYKQGIVPRRPS